MTLWLFALLARAKSGASDLSSMSIVALVALLASAGAQCRSKLYSRLYFIVFHIASGAYSETKTNFYYRRSAVLAKQRSESES